MADETPDPRNPSTSGPAKPIPLRSNPPVEDAQAILAEYNDANPQGGRQQVEEGTAPAPAPKGEDKPASTGASGADS